MPQRQRRECLGVVHRQDVPLAVAIVVLRQGPPRLACQIGAIRVWQNVNLSTTTNDTLVQFDVLVANQPHIILPIFLEHFTRSAAERHRLHLLLTVNARAERGVAHAKLIPQHLADGQRFGRFVQHIRLAHRSHVVGLQSPLAVHQH